MITYRITSKNTQIKQKPSSDKEEVLARILERASTKATKLFPVGSKVVWVGSKREGEVLAVHTEMSKVHWKKEKPFFIRIKFLDNEQIVLTHSSSIRRKKS
jgi:hypothetical protein